MKKALQILLCINSYALFAQINFESENIVIDESYFSVNLTDLFSEDLDNDGFKELIVSRDNSIIWYKNENGDLLYNQPYVVDNVDTPKGISSFDINNDGLKDLLVASQYGDKIIWYKNLGNNLFSSELIIATSINNPQSIVAGDINNDGYKDIIVGTGNDESVICFLNNGNGTFSNFQVINTSIYDVRKIRLFDVNNDGLLDIVSSLSNNIIYLNKNIGNGNFEEKSIITSVTNNKYDFDFIDVNNDGFFDLICNRNGKISYILNQNGEYSNNFTIIDNITSDTFQIKAKDLNNDGLSDIVISKSNGNAIGWYKNNGTGFSTLSIINNNNASSPRLILLADINNDNKFEIICSFHSTSDIGASKLSYFSHNSTSNFYEEILVSTYSGAIRNIKIGDLNNDGLNDIVSGGRNIVWNKNQGNSKFSLFNTISNNNSSFAYTVDLADMNNDGLLDVLGVKSALHDIKLEIYKNEGNERFTLVRSISLPVDSRDFKIADINGDGNPDIILTFISGETRLAVIKNLGNFTFNTMGPVSFELYEYEPDRIKPGDIDNDGDIDILVSSRGKASIQWLMNDGAGNFSIHPVATSILTDAIELVDIDKNGYLDIVSAGNSDNNPYNVYWIPNNAGSFGAINIIDPSQSLSSLAVGDINNDGYSDVVGVSYEYYEPYDERLITYTFNGISFEKTIVDNLGSTLSYERNLDLGDLNNDGKLDIATCYYFIGRASFYMNSSVLQTKNISNYSHEMKLYPNPTSGKIFWNSSDGDQSVQIFNELGQAISDEIMSIDNSLDLSGLNKGIYFIEFKNQNKKMTRKVIKE